MTRKVETCLAIATVALVTSCSRQAPPQPSNGFPYFPEDDWEADDLTRSCISDERPVSRWDQGDSFYARHWREGDAPLSELAREDPCWRVAASGRPFPGAVALLQLGCLRGHHPSCVLLRQRSSGKVPAATPSGMVAISGGTFRNFTVGPFYVDREEVSLHSYQECVFADACYALPQLPEKFADCIFHWNEKLYDSPDPKSRSSKVPIVSIGPEDAHDYCAWRGKRLLMPWEWEWVARGRDEARTFPWGAAEPADDFACWKRRGACDFDAFGMDTSRDGVRHLAGNVAEWVVGAEGFSLVRGSAWNAFASSNLRADYHPKSIGEAQRFPDVGIRCAIGVPSNADEEVNARNAKSARFEAIAAYLEPRAALWGARAVPCNSNCTEIPKAPPLFEVPGSGPFDSFPLRPKRPYCELLKDNLVLSDEVEEVEYNRSSRLFGPSDYASLREALEKVIRESGLEVEFGGGYEREFVLVTRRMERNGMPRSVRSSLPRGGTYFYQLRVRAASCTDEKGAGGFCGARASTLRLRIQPGEPTWAEATFDEFSLELEEAVQDWLFQLVLSDSAGE